MCAYSAKIYAHFSVFVLNHMIQLVNGIAYLDYVCARLCYQVKSCVDVCVREHVHVKGLIENIHEHAKTLECA